MPPSRASNMSSYPNQGPSRRLGWPMKPNPGSARAATGAPVMRPILACLSAASAWTVASTMVTRAWNAGLVGASLPMICGPLLDRPPDIDEAVSLRVTSRPSPAFSPISHQKLVLVNLLVYSLAGLNQVRITIHTRIVIMHDHGSFEIAITGKPVSP